MAIRTERLNLPKKRQTDIYNIDDFHNEAMEIIDAFVKANYDPDVKDLKDKTRDNSRQIDIEQFSLTPNDFSRQTDGSYRARLLHINKHTVNLNKMSVQVNFKRADFDTCLQAGVEQCVDMAVIDAGSKTIAAYIYSEYAPSKAVSGEYVVFTEVV